MKVVGIIAEYNPFHTGHAYQIKEAKKKSGADFVVVVMSGNYTQRGLPAICPAQYRIDAALQNGADLVLELPLSYATGSAERFAFGGVSLLNHTGIVQNLSFGIESETEDLSLLSKYADILMNEPEVYRTSLKGYLSAGLSFPAAREKAISRTLGTDATRLGPNEILGLEYIKALKKTHSQITPVPITRIGTGYHSESLPGISEKNMFASATAIRKALLKGSQSDAACFLPDGEAKQFSYEYRRTMPIEADDFSLLLHRKLQESSEVSLGRIQDITPSLADKIINHLEDYISFSQFTKELTSKDTTESSVCRGLLHILLDLPMIPGSDSDYPQYPKVPYIRILGFRSSAKTLLHELDQHADLPIITKLSKASESLSKEQLLQLQSELSANDLYRAVILNKYRTKMPNDYRTPITILK